MADARGEFWYFEDGVDPNKITVPELRSILLRHEVSWPSSAKKAVLVGLFNDVVLPQKAQVQRSQAHTKRSTRGIVDVPSSSASTATTEDTEDETMMAPVPQSATRAPRRTTRAPTDEFEAPSRRAKTPSRAVPAKHSRAADPEVDERPTARRPRKSVAPAVKEPSPEPEAWHRTGVNSPFTQENPFQSGSSPVVPDTVSREHRRRTTGSEQQREKRKSDAHRRKTYQPNGEQLDQGIVVPSRKTFDVSDPRVQHQDDDAFDAGEEFTPEEQLELVRERAKSGEVDILPPRRRKQRPKAKGTIKAMSGTILFTALAAFGAAWRQEKIAVGFCGIGRDSTQLAGVEIPEWANVVLPQCEPCPPHAQCHRGMSLKCDDDFIKKDHPLSLGGLVPLPPTCEPDSEKERKVKSIANKATTVLRERRAQYECSEPGADGNIPKDPFVTESDLKEDLASKKSKGLTDQEFTELFDRAFSDITLREEVTEKTNTTTGQRSLTSTSLAKLSLSCSVRRSVRQTLERYLLQIVMALFIIATGSYGKYSFDHSRTMEARAKQLAGDAFERLAHQAALSTQDPTMYPDKGISMAQLRDDVLRNEFSASRRQKLWQRVQKKVEFNSNIRAAVKTTATGDVARVWEWIGPIKMIESGNKRESGRYELGRGSSPATPSEGMQEMKKWDEGRPIY